jgi:hypothetical protein
MPIWELAVSHYAAGFGKLPRIPCHELYRQKMNCDQVQEQSQSIRYVKTGKPVAVEMKHNYKKMHKINITGAVVCERNKKLKSQRERYSLISGSMIHSTSFRHRENREFLSVCGP